MAYELFKNIHQRQRRDASVPAVTVNKQRHFYLNVGFVREFCQDFDFALLYWDADEGKIGFQLLKENVPHGSKINKRRGNAFFWARTFLEFIEIDLSISRRFVATWNEEAGLVEIDVSEFIGEKKA